MFKSTLYFLFIECIIESEGMILHIFRDAIHFVLWLMDFYLWVRARNGIDFTILLLFFEDRSLTHAYGQLLLFRW